MQSEGYIEGYSARINMRKLGQTLTVFTEVTLKNHRQIDFARFLSAVEKVEQLIECHLVSGGYDYMLKFVTASIGEYQTIMERLTDTDIGIDKYFSFVVLKSPIVRSQFLKIRSGCKIDNDGIRRSIKSAIAIIAANKTHPARRPRPKRDRRFSREVVVTTMRKRMSGSYADTQIANPHAPALASDHAQRRRDVCDSPMALAATGRAPCEGKGEREGEG